MIEIFGQNWAAYLGGLATTVALTATSFALALVVGVVIAAARVSPIPPLRMAAAIYTEAIRNTPLLVLLFLFIFGLPKVGIQFDFFASAVVVLGGYTGALVAETVRSGINTVAVGQAEAARALGLTFGQSMLGVIMPQALRRMVGPLGGLLVALIKNSALASLISVIDLTAVADRVTTATAQPVLAFGIAGIAYVALAIPTGVAVGRLHHRLNPQP
ncbi:MAG: amino acid ABC transporter permease [Acidimicrobiales bacterium]